MIYFVIYNCFSSYLMAKSRSVDLLLLCYHLYSYEPIIKFPIPSFYHTLYHYG